MATASQPYLVDAARRIAPAEQWEDGSPALQDRVRTAIRREIIMSFDAIFWSILAIVFIVGTPMVLLWSMADFVRGKGSQRRGGGSLSAGVGAALQELDRLAARPSVEHQIEAERHATKRQDDTGGE